MKHRPPTTGAYSADNRGHWAVFWHVEGLHALPKASHLPIAEIQAYRGGNWRKNAPPRGPELVEFPMQLRGEV